MFRLCKTDPLNFFPPAIFCKTMAPYGATKVPRLLPAKNSEVANDELLTFIELTLLIRYGNTILNPTPIKKPLIITK